MRPCLGLFFDRMIMLAVVCSAMSSLAMFFWGNFLTCLHWGNSTWCITPCLKFRNLRYQKPHLSSDQNPSWVVTLEGWSTWFVGVCYHPQWESSSQPTSRKRDDLTFLAGFNASFCLPRPMMSSKLRRLQRRGELGEDHVKYLLEITLGFLWDYLILGGKNLYIKT